MRQQVEVEFELRQQRLRPVALGDVQQQHAAGVAHFGGEFAGQPPAHFVLRQQHLAELVEILRLVIAQPENLRRGEAGQRRIGDHLDQLRAPAGALFDLLALGGRALIVPQKRAADHAVLLVEKHRAVHLARQADRLHVGRLELGFLDDRPDCGRPSPATNRPDPARSRAAWDGKADIRPWPRPEFSPAR